MASALTNQTAFEEWNKIFFSFLFGHPFLRSEPVVFGNGKKKILRHDARHSFIKSSSYVTALSYTISSAGVTLKGKQEKNPTQSHLTLMQLKSTMNILFSVPQN